MAKDEAAGRIVKIVKLLEVLGEVRGKENAILEEIEALTSGGPGIGLMVRDVMNGFHHAWGRRYGGGYLWQATKDVPAIKRLIKGLGHQEVNERIVCYLANTDPFFGQKRHPFGLFVATVNQHVPPAADALALETAAASVVGCSHSPLCRSDQEHTKKRTAEMMTAF